MSDLASATDSYYPTVGFTIMAASLWDALCRCAPAAARAWRKGYAQAMEEFAPNPTRPLVGDVHLFTRRVLNIEAKGKPGRRPEKDDMYLAVYGISRVFYRALQGAWNRETSSYEPSLLKLYVEEVWNDPTSVPLPSYISRRRRFPARLFEKDALSAHQPPKKLALLLTAERFALTEGTVEQYYERGARLARSVMAEVQRYSQGRTNLWTP